MELIALLALLSTEANAASLKPEDCPGKDYSEKLGDVRDQVGTEWCWAFTAADLIGFHQDLKPGQQISPIDVALNGLTITKQKVWDGAIASGGVASFRFAKDASTDMKKWRVADRALAISARGGSAAYGVIAYNTRKRACLDSELPTQSRAPFLVNHSSILPPVPAEKKEVLFPTPPVSKHNDDLELISARLRNLTDNSRNLDKVWAPLKGIFFCKNSDADFLDSYSNFFEEYNEVVLAQVEKEALALCVAGPKLRPLEVTEQNFEKGESSEAAKRAAAILRSGSPLGMRYSRKFLREGYDSSKIYESDHASVIAGMRWNADSKSCEFKLRNSWGGDCRGYRKELQRNCDFGNLWITEAEMNQLAGAVVHAYPLKQ